MSNGAFASRATAYTQPLTTLLLAALVLILARCRCVLAITASLFHWRNFVLVGRHNGILVTIVTDLYKWLIRRREEKLICFDSRRNLNNSYLR